MGQSPSSFRNKSGRQRSFRSFVRRSKLNKSSLSHTFNLPPSEEYPELMNINTASEEQLMTLPGVNRQLARAIVKHRQIIGRFKRVDDLALVSGIGAERLEILRPEICTNTKKQLSRASSCTQSLDSIRLNQDNRLCSINSASVFQLQCVPGLNQEIAANIVDHRNKKGPFKSLDDLIKVRGIDIVRLSAVKQHLSLEPRKCESVQQLHTGNVNGWSAFSAALQNGVSSTPNGSHKKSLSMPIRIPVTLPNGFAAAPVNDILDLLSAYSHRPIIVDEFKYERDGVRCCRLASWNINQLSIDKINNPGVREVICRTILENKLSVIAVQDVLEETALRIICEELNNPHLRRVREWKCNSQRWEYCMSTQDQSSSLGFIFESASKVGVSVLDVELTQVLKGGEEDRSLLEEVAKLRCCGLCAGAQAFQICGVPFCMINVHCKENLSVEDCDQMKRVGEVATRIGVEMVLFGDFFTWDNVHSLKPTYKPLLSEDIQTNLDQNIPGQSSMLCLSEVEKTNFNGYSGSIRSGLSHLAIPRGWSWGGPASPFCPIWCEYNVPD